MGQNEDAEKRGCAEERWMKQWVKERDGDTKEKNDREWKDVI